MVSLLSNLGHAFAPVLTGSVGNGFTNSQDDVRKVSSSLKKLKYYDRDDEAMLTGPLDGAIKKFQKDNGLKIDGVMHPGGETERQIAGLLRSPPRLQSLSALQDGVGTGQTNREDDVRVLETGLGSLNYLPAVHKIQPSGFMTAGIETGLRKFQADKNLKQDGMALPGGETWTALSQLISSAAPVSKQKNKYLNNIDDEKIRDFLVKSEYDVPYFYKDTTDNVTIGIGKMLGKDYPLNKIKFHFLNKDRAPIRSADLNEIESDFARVQALPRGLHYSKYSIGKDKDYIGITKAESQRILDEEIQLSARELRSKLKEFDTYPPSVQKALLDMQFNMGNTRFSPQKWPSFYDALNKRDWRRAAVESHRKGIGETRNKDVYELLYESK